MNSLRLRLLTIIGTSLIAIWSVVAAWMIAGLHDELRTAMDDRLAASARMVAGLAAQFPSATLAAGVPAAPLLDVVARDGLACEVSVLRGEVSMQKVARTASSPAMDDVASGYSTRVFGGKFWRTYVLRQGGLRIATAERIELRESMLRNVALTTAIPFGVALVGTLLALWFGIGGGLAPLERMRSVLAARKPDDDTPLPQVQVPRELTPLVATIGSLLHRVRSMIARERRFSDDAAHELRTPLTAVKTHLQVLRLALGRTDNSEVSNALAHADEGVLRMQRTLEQLLLLARLEGPRDSESWPKSDPMAAARQAVSEIEASRECRGQVNLEVNQDPGKVAIPDTLLVSALRNLLENALQASASGGAVELRIQRLDNDCFRFQVLDRGCGMNEAECAMATSRFWRRNKSGQGSGLGLSIVNGIARRYGGELRLVPRQGGGLCANFTLPIAAY
jgi:signal transduction histidine kinase